MKNGFITLYNFEGTGKAVRVSTESLVAKTSATAEEKIKNRIIQGKIGKINPLPIKRRS